MPVTSQMSSCKVYPCEVVGLREVLSIATVLAVSCVSTSSQLVCPCEVVGLREVVSIATVLAWSL